MESSRAGATGTPVLPRDIVVPTVDRDAQSLLEQRKREAYETGIVDEW